VVPLAAVYTDEGALRRPPESKSEELSMVVLPGAKRGSSSYLHVSGGGVSACRRSACHVEEKEEEEEEEEEKENA